MSACRAPLAAFQSTSLIGYCERVFMLLAIFFFLITKGLKIIAVTKFSLKEVKSLSVWPRLFQLQGGC